MDNKEIKERLAAVINKIDEMSRNGSLELKGILAIQQMAGCVGVLQEIAAVLPVEENGSER